MIGRHNNNKTQSDEVPLWTSLNNYFSDVKNKIVKITEDTKAELEKTYNDEIRNSVAIISDKLQFNLPTNSFKNTRRQPTLVNIKMNLPKNDPGIIRNALIFKDVRTINKDELKITIPHKQRYKRIDLTGVNLDVSSDDGESCGNCGKPTNRYGGVCRSCILSALRKCPRCKLICTKKWGLCCLCDDYCNEQEKDDELYLRRFIEKCISRQAYLDCISNPGGLALDSDIFLWLYDEDGKFILDTQFIPGFELIDYIRIFEVDQLVTALKENEMYNSFIYNEDRLKCQPTELLYKLNKSGFLEDPLYNGCIQAYADNNEQQIDVIIENVLAPLDLIDQAVTKQWPFDFAKFLKDSFVISYNQWKAEQSLIKIEKDEFDDLSFLQDELGDPPIINSNINIDKATSQIINNEDVIESIDSDSETVIDSRISKLLEDQYKHAEIDRRIWDQIEKDNKNVTRGFVWSDVDEVKPKKKIIKNEGLKEKAPLLPEKSRYKVEENRYKRENKYKKENKYTRENYYKSLSQSDSNTKYIDELGKSHNLISDFNPYSPLDIEPLPDRSTEKEKIGVTQSADNARLWKKRNNKDGKKMQKKMKAKLDPNQYEKTSSDNKPIEPIENNFEVIDAQSDEDVKTIQDAIATKSCNDYFKYRMKHPLEVFEEDNFIKIGPVNFHYNHWAGNVIRYEPIGYICDDEVDVRHISDTSFKIKLADIKIMVFTRHFIPHKANEVIKSYHNRQVYVSFELLNIALKMYKDGEDLKNYKIRLTNSLWNLPQVNINRHSFGMGRDILNNTVDYALSRVAEVNSIDTDFSLLPVSLGAKDGSWRGIRCTTLRYQNLRQSIVNAYSNVTTELTDLQVNASPDLSDLTTWVQPTLNPFLTVPKQHWWESLKESLLTLRDQILENYWGLLNLLEDGVRTIFGRFWPTRH